MENETAPSEEPPKKGRAKYAFLALAPIPFGLLLGPVRLADASFASLSQSGHPKGLFIAYDVFTLICCVAGGIGMCGGFKKGAWKGRMGGVMIGVILWVVEASIVLFVGCCKGLSEMH